MAIGTAIDYFMACCFTDEQKERLLELIYDNSVSSIAVNPANGEMGVLQAVNVNFNIQSNDDEFTAASINQGVGDVLARVNLGPQIYAGGNKATTTVFTLSMAYNRNGVPTNENKSATFTKFVPQWAGGSDKTIGDWDVGDYVEINLHPGYQKFLQASANISKAFTTVDGYPWFIVNIGNGIIKDSNGFQLSIGNWGDPATFFWRKPFALVLADGVTVGGLWIIRTRETKNYNNTILNHIAP